MTYKDNKKKQLWSEELLFPSKLEEKMTEKWRLEENDHLQRYKKETIVEVGEVNVLKRVCYDAEPIITCLLLKKKKNSDYVCAHMCSNVCAYTYTYLYYIYLFLRRGIKFSYCYK